MKTKAEPNIQMMLQSAIQAKQVAYEEHKKILVKWIQSTWIGNSGEFVTLKTDYAERLKKAEEQFRIASVEVEHYKMQR